jgi:hypothetical protein
VPGAVALPPEDGRRRAGLETIVKESLQASRCDLMEHWSCPINHQPFVQL